MLKLKTEKKVRDYELTILIPGDFTSTELKKILDVVSELIKKLGGEVKESQDWGKQPLAYTVEKQSKKYRDAVYTHLIFTLDAQKVQDLERQLLLNQDIIRHLLVVASTQTPTKPVELKQKSKR